MLLFGISMSEVSPKANRSLAAAPALRHRPVVQYPRDDGQLRVLEGR